MSILIISWDEKEFLNSKYDWTALLARSDSDKLFMSWEWQYAWWKIFKDEGNMCLRMFTAVDENNNLVGIAPLYITNVITKKVISTRRLQFIGNCWRGKATMPTEIVDFIADKDVSSEVINVFYEHINSLGSWDEFILSNLSKNTTTYKRLVADKKLDNCYFRCAETYHSYYLDTTGNFDDYLKKLSKTMRLKLFNRRKLIDNMGDASFEYLDVELDECFKLLNHLHRKRWGSDVFKDDRLEFNKTVSRLMTKNDSVQFSVILFNKEPISIQYNYIVNNRKYNIQAGFDELFHKKISLGYLHFGYEIESAFKGNVTAYDFLMGEGKKIQYKERLRSTKFEMVDMQIIRNNYVGFLYKLYDRVKATLSSVKNND